MNVSHYSCSPGREGRTERRETDVTVRRQRLAPPPSIPALCMLSASAGVPGAPSAVRTLRRPRASFHGAPRVDTRAVAERSRHRVAGCWQTPSGDGRCRLLAASNRQSRGVRRAGFNRRREQRMRSLPPGKWSWTGKATGHERRNRARSTCGVTDRGAGQGTPGDHCVLRVLAGAQGRGTSVNRRAFGKTRAPGTRARADRFALDRSSRQYAGGESETGTDVLRKRRMLHFDLDNEDDTARCYTERIERCVKHLANSRWPNSCAKSSSGSSQAAAISSIGRPLWTKKSRPSAH
jgi:hypothetical protein